MENNIKIGSKVTYTRTDSNARQLINGTVVALTTSFAKVVFEKQDGETDNGEWLPIASKFSTLK